MNEIVSFYNNFYTSDNIPEKEVDEYLNNILGESDKKLCDEELTYGNRKCYFSNKK